MSRILFVVDAGPLVGGGHVMRSLSLAQALAARGATPIFLSPPPVAEILQAFAPETPRISAPAGGPETLIAAAAFADVEAVVFDHYGLSREAHEAIGKGRPRLVVDDLADRPLGADVVLDPGPQRTSADYAQLAPGARLLLGPQYAPLRPEFSALREAAMARRDGPVRRILISMGLTDVGGITGQVLQKLRSRLGMLAIDVVLGAAAPSRRGLERLAAHDPRLELHIDTPDMAVLAAEADAAIGAAGSSTWERCALALPSVLVVLAENQRPGAAAVAEAGAALVVDREAADFEAQLDRAIVRLLADAGLRRRLSEAAASMCDGLGAPRVAEAFLGIIAARGSLPQSQTQQV
ncbi:UDP-2,4-diacetamido-2,4,6-trideoxy-beta-L-altropyranose hydrolase [Phenylobacterium terrae]|uniref:UDP-2,4-diacetamido-2,4, 6-trideoxy-beta-L-altropyranose hydrolase n=1 Tax=Phenylobacterium terrae TaxID=2665495 RepID=A0ABW4N6Z4_9CAUL